MPPLALNWAASTHITGPARLHPPPLDQGASLGLVSAPVGRTGPPPSWARARPTSQPQLLGVTRASAIRFVAEACVRVARSLLFVFDGPLVVYGPAVFLFPSCFCFLPISSSRDFYLHRRCRFIAAWFALSPFSSLQFRWSAKLLDLSSILLLPPIFHWIAFCIPNFVLETV